MVNPEVPTAISRPFTGVLPLDIRLLPGLGGSLLACWFIPRMSTGWVIPTLVVLYVVAALSAWVALARSRKNDIKRASSWWVIISVATFLTALPATSAALQTQTVTTTGWSETVASEEVHKFSVTVRKESTVKDATFGPRCYTQVEVIGFGYPHQDLPYGKLATISGTEAWEEALPQQTYCLAGKPNNEGGTVFISEKTPPTLGACDDAVEEEISAVPTGRDSVRAAFRTASAAATDNGRQLLPGLVLGDRSQQSEQLDEAMKVAGLSHLSAVSGLHVALLVTALTLFLRTLRVHRRIVFVTVLCALGLFGFIVGWEPSVIRASIMGGISAWTVVSGRGGQALPILCLTGIMMLSLNPQLVEQPSFQLSLTATVGIVLMARPLEQFLAEKCLGWLPSMPRTFLSSSFAISFAAQIACQPILIAMTGNVNLYSVPANMLVTPLVPFVTIPGTVAAILSFWLPAVSGFILGIVGYPAGWIAQTALWVASWESSLVEWPIGALGVILTILHIAGTWVLVLKLNRWQRREIPPVVLLSATPAGLGSLRRILQAPEPSYRSLAEWAILVIAVVGQIAVLLPVSATQLDQNWSIYACDVGQGDMFLIRTASHRAIAIDTGPEPSLASQCLDDADIDVVDAIFISHLHNDHYGGVDAVLKHTPEAPVYFSTALAEDGADPSAVLPATATQLSAGDHGQFGTATDYSVEWNVLHANADASFENDSSMVLDLTISRVGTNVTAIFTGDLEEDEARAWLATGNYPEHVDILKLAHHGAKNGGTETIETLRPAAFLIGVGEDNSYGHPNQDIIATAELFGDVTRTDQHGASTVTITDSGLEMTRSG